MPTTAPATHQSGRCCIGDECIEPGSRIVYMGDSLMRYMYLDLVFGLSLKDHELQREDRNPLQENSWPDWQSFLDGTTAGLSPNEVCDCHRDPAMNYSTVAENRIFHQPDCNVTVAFVLVFGSKPVNGRWMRNGFVAHRFHQNPNAPARTQRSWNAVLRQHIAPLRPTALVLSASLWPMDGLSFESLQHDAAHTSPCVAWKTASQYAQWISGRGGPTLAKRCACQP